MNIQYVVTREPVGFLVYAKQNGTNLSLGDFCNATSSAVLDIMKILTIKGGFKPEVNDALAFFLFEDNANSFIEVISEL